MKNAIVAAVVAALVSSGATLAATTINGRAIARHSIPVNRLTPRAQHALRGQRGRVGPQGPAGPQGLQGVAGPAGPNGPQGMSIFAYPDPGDPAKCVDIYQEVHQYVDLQVFVDAICAPGGHPSPQH